MTEEQAGRVIEILEKIVQKLNDLEGAIHLTDPLDRIESLRQQLARLSRR